MRLIVTSRDVQNYQGLTIAIFTGELNPRLFLCVSLNNSKASFPLSQPTSLLRDPVAWGNRTFCLLQVAFLQAICTKSMNRLGEIQNIGLNQWQGSVNKDTTSFLGVDHFSTNLPHCSSLMWLTTWGGVRTTKALSPTWSKYLLFR